MNELVVNRMSGEERKKLITTLQNSLYTGAAVESVEMVLSYCEAAGLDPMQKPVHIVPMSVKDPQTGKYVFRDVVMAGIGLYRIQADRSGTLAGASEPEFGADVTQTFTDKNNNQVQVTYPEWCKVSMKKLIGNHIVEFVAKEYWLENYATDSRGSNAPNAMWKKRPKGQLVKCAEAQALRKGWPEIGQAPTAEEMAGKEIDMGEAERDEPTQPEQVVLPVYPEEDFEKNLKVWLSLIEGGKKTKEDIVNMVETKYTLTVEQKDQIK